jgi:hypothetical protein
MEVGSSMEVGSARLTPMSRTDWMPNPGHDGRRRGDA